MFRKFLPVLALTAIATLLISTQVVFAHSRPVRLDPPPGAILTSAPAQVTGWFTGALRRDPNWNFIQVTDAQGNRVDSGDVVLSSDRKQMSVALRPGLAEGRYVVTWRTFDDADNAIFGDCYAFFVGQAAADAAIAGNQRLDGGGSTCQRIDTSAANGTPVPGQTPTAGHEAPPSGGGSETHSEEDGGGGGGVPVWVLVLGVVGGVAIGGIGGKALGKA